MTPEEIFDKAIGFNVEDKVDSLQSKIDDLQKKIVELRYLQAKTIKELKGWRIKSRMFIDRANINIAKFFLMNERSKIPSVDEQFDFIAREEKESTPLLNALAVETNKPQRRWRMPHPESDAGKIVEFIRNHPECNRQMIRDNLKLECENVKGGIKHATRIYSQNGLLIKHNRNGSVFFSFNG